MIMMKKVLVLSIVIFLGIGLHAQNTSTDSLTVSLIQQMAKADFKAKVMDYDKYPDSWVYKGKKPCVVFFYTEKSVTSQTASPVLEEFALEYQGKIDFYKVNVDKEKELLYVLEIKSVPTFMYCPMTGNPKRTMGVANNKKQIRQMFKSDILKILPK
jgi:thioredoxin 1